MSRRPVVVAFDVVETLFSLERVNAQFQDLYGRLMRRRRRAAGQAPAVSSV